MKKILVMLLMVAVGFSYAQKERTLELNEDTGLIEVTYFHNNGTVSQTGFYNKDGKLQGDWFSYCKEGNKLIAAKYNNGQKVGKWIYWMDDVIKEVDYTKNQVSQVTDKYNTIETLASNK